MHTHEYTPAHARPFYYLVLHIYITHFTKAEHLDKNHKTPRSLKYMFLALVIHKLCIAFSQYSQFGLLNHIRKPFNSECEMVPYLNVIVSQ